MYITLHHLYNIEKQNMLNKNCESLQSLNANMKIGASIKAKAIQELLHDFDTEIAEVHIKKEKMKKFLE
jgi:hypothetical protein